MPFRRQLLVPLKILIHVIYFTLPFNITAAHSSCIHFEGAEKPVCHKEQKQSKNPGGSLDWSVDPSGLYAFYRFANVGEGHRRCRLQPTCSLFTVRAVQKYGLLKGLLSGLARSQMEHSH